MGQFENETNPKKDIVLEERVHGRTQMPLRKSRGRVGSKIRMIRHRQRRGYKSSLRCATEVMLTVPRQHRKLYQARSVLITACSTCTQIQSVPATEPKFHTHTTYRVIVARDEGKTTTFRQYVLFRMAEYQEGVESREVPWVVHKNNVDEDKISECHHFLDQK